MLAPRGWREPAQTPEFDEVVVVLKGTLTLVLNEKLERIAAGEVGFVPRDTRVVYRNDAPEPCDYLSVCTPAFLAELGNPYAGVGTDPNGRWAVEWGTYGVPETFVIAGDGTVIDRLPMPITPGAVEERLRASLAKAAGE